MRFGLLTFCLAITLAAGLALAAPSPAADTAAKPAAEPAAKAPSAAEKPAAPAVDPKAKTPAGDAPTSDAQFFAELGYKDAASAHDVARAMVILASEGKECGADFEKCKAYLKGRGVLPDGWLDKAKAEDPVDKSALASLVCRSLDIKGGLWMRLFGPQPRFALRECIYHELMVPGADYAYVSGGELVGVIDRCDRWRAKEAGRELPKLSTPAATEVKK
jgi:hypothetical protein